MSIRVAVADDQALIRDGIRSQLGYVTDIEFVGAASNGAEAVELAMTALPDVLLMDVRMPLGHSSDVITREIYTHLFDADTARHAKGMAAGGRPTAPTPTAPATVTPIREAG